MIHKLTSEDVIYRNTGTQTEKCFPGWRKKFLDNHKCNMEGVRNISKIKFCVTRVFSFIVLCKYTFLYMNQYKCLC